MRFVTIAVLFSALGAYAIRKTDNLRVEDTSKFKLNSHSFSDGATIPKKYTCDGDDLSPELHWTDQPSAAKSFALIVDDPDAPSGPWGGWVLFNCLGDGSYLAE